MADTPFTGGIATNGHVLPEKAVDLGDGTFARAVSSVSSAAQAAAARQTYTRAAAVSATPGDAVLISGVTTLGTVTLTLSGGGTVVVSVPVGSTILPFAVTAAALGTALGGTFQSLFFT